MLSEKHLMRPPTDHIKRLLEEAYLNNAYPSSTSSGTAA
jgi:hypothetical protein